MIYERHHFGDTSSLVLSLYGLLFEPGSQLMHVHRSPWTEVEAQAVTGLKILRAIDSLSFNVSYSRFIFEESEEFYDSARKLILMFGYDKRVFVSIARLFAYVRRRFTLNDERWGCADQAWSMYYRLANRVEKELGGWIFRLVEFLNRNAGQIRGRDSGLADRWRWPVQRAEYRQPLCKDWSGGGCFQAVFSKLPVSVMSEWSARAEVGVFDANGALQAKAKYPRSRYSGHLASGLASEFSQLPDPQDVHAVCDATQWALLNCGAEYPRLICRSRQCFEALLQEATQLGAEVMLQDLGLPSGVSCNAIVFRESSRVFPGNMGMPAIIAARHEGVMPWLLLSLVDFPNLWFLESTAEWNCFGLARDVLLCKPRSESAILAAFSRLGQDDNIAFGAISGRIDEAQIRELLQRTSDWGTEAVLQRARFAPWAYGHQWGGGSDEHFSIFCAQDVALTAALAKSLGAGKFSWL